MTQADLAKAIGKAPQQVSAWERDEGIPRHANLSALVKALNIRREWLLLGIGPMQAEVAMEASASYRADPTLSAAKRIILRALEADLSRMTDEQAEAWFVSYQKTMDKLK